MNEQANKILIDLLQKASNGIDAAVSFSQAQVPDVINQLLIWKFVSSVVTTVLILATVPFAYKFLKKMIKREEDGVVGSEGYSWDRGRTKYKPTLIWQKDGDINPACIFLGFSAAIYVFIVFACLADLTWLKIWLAPKLYLIEYAASLVK